MMILFRRRIQRYRCGGGCTSKSGKHFTQPLVATTCEMGFRLKTIFSQLHTLPRWPDSDSCKESDRSWLNRGKVDVISSHHGHFHRIRIGFGVLAVGTCGCKTVVLARPPLAEASTRSQSHRPCRPSQLGDFGQPHPPRGSKRSGKEPVEVSDLPYRQRAAPRRILPPNQQQRARQLSQLAIPSDGSPSSPRRARSPGLRALRQLRPKRNGRSGGFARGLRLQAHFQSSGSWTKPRPSLASRRHEEHCASCKTTPPRPWNRFKPCCFASPVH